MDAITWILITIVLILVSCIAFGMFLIKELKQEREKDRNNLINIHSERDQLDLSLKEERRLLQETQEKLEKETTKNKSLLSQKKSSETRLGQISEHLVPFLANCTHDPKNLHFLGNPIDYIGFDFDDGKITFLEIKSGNSKTSKRQKTIKNIIKNGRIYYEEIRINEKGIKTKKTDNKK